jgi:hypothetical protein|tara:strand:+ start:7015 stop:7692 length:678 start_codon:yes stop_codon:yes gene_type:complete
MEMHMQLSDNTLKILSNFATVNANMVLKPGQQLKTISEAKNILATADIVEDFPKEMGIYDLNEFLSIHGLVENPTLEFEENAVLIKDGSNKVRYFFAQPSILTTPDKDITMPETDVQIHFTEESLGRIKKAASVLGHIDFCIEGKEDVIAKVYDAKDSSANTYELNLGPNTTGHSFNFVMNISNLKLIDGSYDVFISSKLISKWQNITVPVNYFIALEKTSTFNV